jgi:predicted aconitase with swiveling domain
MDTGRPGGGGMDVTTVEGQVLHDGPTVEGPWLCSDVPLSLWGGLDPATGMVVDRQHPLCGVSLTGAIVALPGGRGSSTASAVWVEAVRRGTAPAALVLARPDPILLLGTVVAELLYNDRRLLVTVAADVWDRLPGAGRARLDRRGVLCVAPL